MGKKSNNAVDRFIMWAGGKIINRRIKRYVEDIKFRDFDEDRAACLAMLFERDEDVTSITAINELLIGLLMAETVQDLREQQRLAYMTLGECGEFELKDSDFEIGG